MNLRANIAINADMINRLLKKYLFVVRPLDKRRPADRNCDPGTERCRAAERQRRGGYARHGRGAVLAGELAAADHGVLQGEGEWQARTVAG